MLRQRRVCHVSEDGTETLLEEVFVTTDVPFELPPFYVNAVAATETRTPHLVAEPDTEWEEMLTLTAPRNAYIGVLAEGLYGLYNDRDCLHPNVAPEIDSIPEEMTLYLRYE